MEQIFELHEHEDVHSIRDRIEYAQSKRVLLVIPPYSNVLRKRIDLQLIQRCAQERRVEIALVTRDGDLRAFAHELEIPVFGDVEAGQRRQRWHKHDDLFGPYRPPDREEAHRAAQDRDARMLRSELRQRLWLIARAALLAIVTVAVIVTAIAVVPSAELYLVPQSQRVVANATVIVDPDLDVVDVAGARAPARSTFTEVRGEITIPTTGKKELPSSRATGVVFFVNQLNIPTRVSQGTVVRTSAGAQAIRFVVTSNVEIPGGIGAQAQAPIEAVEVGAQGNVPANFINEIEGVGALALRVSNPEPTRNGGNREVAAAAPEDLNTARNLLLAQLKEQALAEMAADLADTEFLLASSVQTDIIIDATYDKEVTEEGPDLTLQMRAQFSALVVDSEDANAIVFEVLRVQSPIAYDLLGDGLAFQRSSETPIGESGQYQFEMQATGFAAAELDVNSAREEIAGKPIAAAIAILEQRLPLQRPPSITVFPDWFPLVPLLPVRINTVVNASG
jgi:hypothetical protein